MADLISQKARVISNDTLVSSIDIGMNSHYGYFVTMNGESIKPFKFANNRSGFDEFWSKLLKSKSDCRF